MMHILIALVAVFVGVIVGYLISKRGIARAEQRVAD